MEKSLRSACSNPRASFCKPGDSPTSTRGFLSSTKARDGGCSGIRIIRRSPHTLRYMTGLYTNWRATAAHAVTLVSPAESTRASLMPHRRLHRHFHGGFLGKFFCFAVSRVGVPNDSHARVSRQHALDAFGHLIGSVSNCDLAGVKRIADADPTAVMDRDPGRASGGVQQGIEQGPVGDRV